MVSRGSHYRLAFSFIVILTMQNQIFSQAAEWLQAPGFRGTNGSPEPSISPPNSAAIYAPHAHMNPTAANTSCGRDMSSASYNPSGFGYASVFNTAKFNPAVSTYQWQLPRVPSDWGHRSQSENGKAFLYPYAGYAPAYIALSLTTRNIEVAIESKRRSLALSEAAGDKVGQMTSHAALAELFVQQGNIDEARTQVGLAERAVDKSGDQRIQVTLLRVKSAILMASGKFEEAVNNYQTVVSVLREPGNESEQAAAQTSLGWAYQSLGDVARALTTYEKARQSFVRLGDRNGETRVTLAIGSLYQSIGEFKKASEEYTRIAPIASGEQFAQMLASAAEMDIAIEDPEKALVRYEEALALNGTFDDSALGISILTGIGRCHMALGHYALAQQYFDKADVNATLTRDDRLEAGVSASIGELHYWMAIRPPSAALSPLVLASDPTLVLHQYLLNISKHLSKALGAYKKSLASARAAGDRIGEIGLLTNTGLAYDAWGKQRDALASYLAALQKLEDLQTAARLEELRIDLASQSAGLYQRVIELEAGQHHIEEAFNLSERARARTLLDQLGNPRIDFGKNAPVSFLQRQRQLRQENITLRRQLGQELAKPGLEVNLKRMQSLQARLAAVRTEYEDAVSQLKLTNPQYASFLSISPLTLREAQQQLDPDVTLVSYFTTPQMTLAFVLTKNSFHAERLPVTAGKLSVAIATFLDFAGESDNSPALRFLYHSLIEPIKGKLKTAKLIVVPHGVLHDVPFAALTPDGKSYLNDRYTIAYLPSVSILAYVRSRVKLSGSKALVLANDQEEGAPHLNHAYGEARVVASVLGTRPLLGTEATPSALRARAGDADIIHLIAHFDLDRNNPRSTRILLEENSENDEPFDLDFVASLNLRKTNLVVLSFCQSQLGKRSRGDDVIGLSRAFLYAGAPSVVASLWSVDDEATQKLMIAFYMHLKEGLSKAEALRVAQIDIRQKYPNPYYWAGFVLTGDPGATNNSMQARAIQ